MPELPEVETTCQGIKPVIVGGILNKVILHETRLRWPIPKCLEKLKNITIIDVTRRAKYILISTCSGTLIIHLGMSGRLNIVPKDTPLKKHDHAVFIFNTGMSLRYNDPRRFGAILWTSEDPNQHSLLKKLGPEPFAKEFQAKYLFNKSRKVKITIKQYIMDASIVVGVGNIYANEALFFAQISPLRKAHSLTLIECKSLVSSIREILKKAIIAGGTTLRDFLAPSGNPGYFSQELLVYGREGMACVNCSKILSSIRIGQRATVYCGICQN